MPILGNGLIAVLPVTRLGHGLVAIHTYYKARSGASRFAILSVLVINWFTRLKNERNSVRVAGVGNSEITFVRDGSTL